LLGTLQLFFEKRSVRAQQLFEERLELGVVLVLRRIGHGAPFTGSLPVAACRSRVVPSTLGARCLLKRLLPGRCRYKKEWKLCQNPSGSFPNLSGSFQHLIGWKVDPDELEVDPETFGRTFKEFWTAAEVSRRSRRAFGANN